MGAKLRCLYVLYVLHLAFTVQAENCTYETTPDVHQIIKCNWMMLSEVPDQLPASFLTTEFQLVENRISEIKKSTFRNYPNLREINLKFNHINKIEDGSFDYLVALHQLDLSQNRLKYLEITLPPSLTTLILDNNPLTVLDLGDNQIKTLALSKTLLSRFPLFGPSPFLHSLDLTGTLIKEFTLEDVASLCALEDLRVLDEDSKKKFGSTCKCKTLEKWFQMKNPKLVHDLQCLEDLSCDTYELQFGKEARQLNNLCQKAKRFHDDSTMECKKGNFNSSIFADCSNLKLSVVPLVIKPTVRHLDLSKNEITTLSTSTFQNIPQLENINLSENNIGYVEPYTFRNLKKLKFLNLRSNNINVFKFDLPKSLREFDLSRNPVKFLEEYTHSLTRVRKLSLSNTFLSDIAKLDLPFLTTLDVSHTDISEITSTHIAKFCSLKKINLSNTKLMEAQFRKSCKCTRLVCWMHKQFINHNNQVQCEKDLSCDNADSTFSDEISIFDACWRKKRQIQDEDRLTASQETTTNKVTSLAPTTAVTPTTQIPVTTPTPMVPCVDANEKCEFSNETSMWKCTNINLVAVPRNLTPNNVTKLSLSYNRIRRIERDDFQNYLALEELDLKVNIIDFLAEGCFENLEHLQTLLLENNRLGKFDQILPKLLYLNLQNNPLMYFNVRGPQIKKIDMSQTSLKRFPKFQPSAALKELSLNCEYIDTLTVEDLAPLCSLEKLGCSNPKYNSSKKYLDSCDCYLVQKWINEFHGNKIEGKSVDWAPHCSKSAVCPVEVFPWPATQLRNKCLKLNHTEESLKTTCDFVETDDDSIVFDCSKKNLISMPKINADVTVLYLTKNNFEIIEKSSFQGLAALEHLDLSRNQIKTIAEDSFRHLENLNHLDLSYNSLQTFDQRLPKMTLLDLSHNSIKKLDFGELRVSTLNLQHLPLTELPKYDVLPDLTTLDLTGTELTTIFARDLVPLCSLKRIRLFQTNMLKTNSFQNKCDCESFVYWMKQYNVSYYNLFSCKTSEDVCKKEDIPDSEQLRKACQEMKLRNAAEDEYEQMRKKDKRPHDIISSLPCLEKTNETTLMRMIYNPLRGALRRPNVFDDRFIRHAP